MVTYFERNYFYLLLSASGEITAKYGGNCKLLRVLYYFSSEMKKIPHSLHTNKYQSDSSSSNNLSLKRRTKSGFYFILFIFLDCSADSLLKSQ